MEQNNELKWLYDQEKIVTKMLHNIRKQITANGGKVNTRNVPDYPHDATLERKILFILSQSDEPLTASEISKRINKFEPDRMSLAKQGAQTVTVCCLKMSKGEMPVLKKSIMPNKKRWVIYSIA